MLGTFKAGSTFVMAWFLPVAKIAEVQLDLSVSEEKGTLFSPSIFSAAATQVKSFWFALG